MPSEYIGPHAKKKPHNPHSSPPRVISEKEYEKLMKKIGYESRTPEPVIIKTPKPLVAYEHPKVDEIIHPPQPTTEPQSPQTRTRPKDYLNASGVQ